MPLRQQKYKKHIHGYSSYAFICKVGYNRRSCRVRQLVAKVHTTPLNGRAPNAVYGRSDAPRCSFRSKAKVNCFLHALRSDYRYTSSPPEGNIDY